MLLKKTYYEVIDMLRKDLCLHILLKVSGIKRSSYYKWKNNVNVLTKRKQDNINTSEKIKILYAKHKGRYGVDRMVHALLNDYNLVVNHKHVYRLMKEHGCLAVIKPKKYFKQPERKHSGTNILNRNFQASYPYDKLATDVSVIKKSGKSIYISPIKDLCTNMIESWSISYNASLNIAIAPLLSIKDKALPEGTFMHSD
jgi:putative transposase